MGEKNDKPNITQRIKNSPVMVSLSIMTLAVAALSGLGTITGSWNRAHTDEIELVQAIIDFQATNPHPVSEQQIAEIQQESRCSTIDIQISLVEQAIWNMEQAGQSTQRLVEKRTELRNLQTRRRELRCISV